MPKISVGIPVYNAELYIAQAIQSVLDQSFCDFELIITDDASTDRTPEIINKFSDSRIRYCLNPKQLGPPGNFNRCIELSAGEYISVFHADDIMLRENLEKKKNFLDQNPDAGMVHSNFYRMNAGNQTVEDPALLPFKKDAVMNGQDVFKIMSGDINYICASSVMVRKKCFDEIGAFEVSLAHTCDWEMWLRLGLFYKIGYLSEALIGYRKHEAMHSSLFWNNLRGIQEYYAAKHSVLKKFPEKVPEREEFSKKIRILSSRKALDLFRSQLKEGNISEGFRTFLYFIRQNFFSHD